MSFWCDVCEAVVPVAEKHAGKVFGGLFGAAVSSPSKHPLVMLGATALGALLGHALVDTAAGVVCGRCGSPVRALDAF